MPKFHKFSDFSYTMIVLAGTLKPTLIPWSIENDVPHYYRITSLFEGSYINKPVGNLYDEFLHT